MPDEGSLREELDAEIADHLACAAARLEREGWDADDAGRQANEAFGDIDSIRRRLWWIHEGETVMWRGIGVCLLAITSCGVIALAYGGLRLQRSMEDRLARLTTELELLHQAQRELVARQDQPEVLHISGQAWLGDPSKPAVGVNVHICRLPEGDERAGSPASQRSSSIIKVRSLTTDARGYFDSGPLPPGDYYALAKLLHPDDIAPSNTYYTQSQPYYLYPGMPPTEPAQLDVKLHYGEVVFESSGTLPFLVSREITEAEAAARSRLRGGNREFTGAADRAAIVLEVTLQPGIPRMIPWTPTRPEPHRWPIIGATSERISWKLSPDDFPTRVIVPAGSYRVLVQLFSFSAPKGRYTGRTPADDEKAGILAAAHTNAERRPEGETLGEIKLLEGQTARVRFEIPENYENGLREVMANDRSWHQPFDHGPGGDIQWRGSDFIRKQPLKLTINPMPEA